MLTPVILEKTLVDEIATIGRMRLPNEACGVLLPFARRGRRVWEMPNRSTEPDGAFEMLASDITLELGGWASENNLHWEDLVLWHTHPSGDPSPSKEDLDNRIEYCGNLVVALSDPPMATWF